MKASNRKIIRTLRDRKYTDMLECERKGEDLMRYYHKGRYDAHAQVLDMAEEEAEEQGFWQGSLKVATVLGFLYIVGYLLSKGFAG